MELAAELGMTKGELLERASSEELTEWMALYKIRADESKKRPS